MAFVRLEGTVRREVVSEHVTKDLVIKVVNTEKDTLIAKFEDYDIYVNLPLSAMAKIPLKVVLKSHVKESEHLNTYVAVLRELEKFTKVDRLQNWNGKKCLNYDRYEAHGVLSIRYQKPKVVKASNPLEEVVGV